MPTPDSTTTTEATSSPNGTVLTATQSTTVKPGYRTTEFWLTFLAALVGSFLASGLVADGSTPMRIAGMAAMVLATMGYSVVRGAAKKGGAALVLLFAFALAPTSSGCAASRPYLPPETFPIVDCAAASKADALIVSWFTRRPGWVVVKEEAIAAGVEVGGCAFAAYLQKYLAPPPGTAVPAPELALEAKDVFEQYRSKYALDASFRFPAGDL